MASASGAAAPVQCPTSRKEGQQQYMCKRHAYTCLCSKWFEPVFRTFNGEDIPVEDNAAYNLYSSPTGDYSIDAVLLKGTIVAMDDEDRFANGEYYAPDKWPIVNRVMFTFGSPTATNKSVCHLYTSNSFMNEDDGAAPVYTIRFECSPSVPSGVQFAVVADDQKASPLITSIVRVDAMEKYGFSLAYDGSNLELSVKLSSAASSKPGNGLCGACDDQLRDSVYSRSQIEVDNKFVAARSWMVANDNWPSGSRRVPTCTTDKLLNAAVRLCYPLHSLYWNSQSAPNEATVYKLYRSCLMQVCQYGPAGVCSAFATFKNTPTFCNQGCKNSAGDTSYDKSLSGKYCQYTETALVSKGDFYTAQAIKCQARGYNLANMNPDDFTADTSSNYWTGSVVSASDKILFLLNGTDAIRDDSKYTDNLDGPSACVNADSAGNWKNDLACTEFNKYICAVPSGSCGSTYCTLPQLCNANNTCAALMTVTWP